MPGERARVPANRVPVQPDNARVPAALLAAWRVARRIQGKPGPVQDAARVEGGGASGVAAGNVVPLLPAAPKAEPGRDDHRDEHGQAA